MLDIQDRRILRAIQNQPNASRKTQARSLDMSFGVFARRIEKLEQSGVIGKKRARIDWSKLGFTVKVFLRITLDKTEANALGNFIEAAKLIREIVVIETLVGRVDIRMDVMARDLVHYQEIYVDKILALPHISDVESLLIVSEIKNASELPI